VRYDHSPVVISVTPKFLTTIGAGLNLINVSVYWIQAIRGVIILIAMLIDAQKVPYSTPATRAVAVTAATGLATD
jgi:ribose/xylose/arabinose/galactoside ABC-type transport system permease subunit